MEFKGSEEEKELKVALKHRNQQHGRNEANRRTVSLYTKKNHRTKLTMVFLLVA